MSEISPLRATYHYLSSDVSNLVLFTAASCLLGKYAFSYLGKDTASFPSILKVEDIVNHFFTFGEIGSICKSSIAFSDILFRPSRNMHQETAGVFPREDNQYELRIALNTLSIIFKIASSVIVINKGLESLGVISKGFSQKTRLIGAQVSIGALCIDMHEIERVRRDQQEDIEDERSKQIPAPFDANLEAEKKDLYRKKIQQKRVFDQTYNVCSLSRKIIQMIPLLEENGSLKLEGRFFTSHQPAVSGGLLIGMAFISLFRHVFCGATIRELQKGDVEKCV